MPTAESSSTTSKEPEISMQPAILANLVSPRQPDFDASSLALPRAQPDAPAVRDGHAPDEGQPEARAVPPRGETVLEGALGGPGVHPGAAIGDRQHDEAGIARRLLPRLDRELPARGHRLDRVSEQIVKRIGDEVHVDVAWGKRGRQPFFQVDRT